MGKNWSYKDGTPFTPVTGKYYENLNGVTYECRAGKEGKLWDDQTAWFVSPKGWAFKAVNCRIYPDGRIDWGHSLHGHFIHNPI